MELMRIRMAGICFGVCALVLLTGLGGGCVRNEAVTEQSLDDVSSETSAFRSSVLFDTLAEDLNDHRALAEQGKTEAIIARINTWLTENRSSVDWKVDPLVATLPEAIQKLPAMSEVNLSKTLFNFDDAPALREAVWLRDTARRVAGDEQNELEQALLLFDWTTRNIQLEPDSYADTPFTAEETLFYGRGTREDRAWIFILLLRQAGISAARLETAGEEGAPPGKAAEGAAAVSPTLVGAWNKGQIYLFDAAVGLPIMGPNGKGVATLAQAAADDAVLRQMDVDKDNTYPLTAESLKKVKAQIAASPHALSQRMRMVGSQLSGAQRIVLSVNASEEAEKFKAAPGVNEAGLWLLPFERLARIRKPTQEQLQARAQLHLPFQIGIPMKDPKDKNAPLKPQAALQLGRMRHLNAVYGNDDSEEDNALLYYYAARPTNENLVVFAEQAIKAGAIPKEQFNVGFDIALKGKQNATFWLGVMALERETWKAAVDYLETYSLKEWPNGPWTPGARYNLARALEAMGETKRAVEVYRSTAPPQRYGCLLRAKRLTEKSK